METPTDIASAIYNEIIKADKILFISHRNPDGDTIGSNIALRIFADNIKKRTASACAQPLPPQFNFLPLSATFITDLTLADFDLLVCLDCGSAEQTVFLNQKPPNFQTKIINIDHHPTNTLYGNINLVIKSAASTTEIIFQLLRTWKAKINPEIATCLLTGLYTDTGSFMHSNTGDQVLEIAGELITLGAKRDLIVKQLFKQSSPAKLLLLGKILENTNITEKNVIISALRDEDIADCGAEQSEISGAINYLNCVKNTRFAALLTEDGNGNIRGSLRTRDESVNLSEIAKALGGGGHKKASGFTIQGRIKKEIHWKISKPKK